MLKIYINETPLLLMDEKEGRTRILDSTSDRQMTARYLKKSKTLLQYVDMLEKGGNKHLDSVGIYSDDFSLLVSDFYALFKLIEAAGGLVQNEKKETLFIFRRGWWDLPKGKLDAGETPAQAAIREVQEETGLQQVELGAELVTTFHVYKEGKKRILKKTYWYEMQTSDVELIPQAEEDIEKAEWISVEDFLATPKKVYANILEVLEARTY